MSKSELKFSGAKLQEKRRALHKTQTEIAEFIKVTPQSYGEMERGEINPNSNNLAKLCILFDCTVQELFEIPENFFVKI